MSSKNPEYTPRVAKLVNANLGELKRTQTNPNGSQTNLSGSKRT